MDHREFKSLNGNLKDVQMHEDVYLIKWKADCHVFAHYQIVCNVMSPQDYCSMVSATPFVLFNQNNIWFSHLTRRGTNNGFDAVPC